MADDFKVKNANTNAEKDTPSITGMGAAVGVPAGAAVGFALGGPIGAAVGAAIGAAAGAAGLNAAAKSHNDAGKDMDFHNNDAHRD